MDYSCQTGRGAQILLTKVLAHFRKTCSSSLEIGLAACLEDIETDVAAMLYNFDILVSYWQIGSLDVIFVLY